MAAEPPLATDHDEIYLNFDPFFSFDTQPVTSKSKTGCEIFIPEYVSVQQTGCVGQKERSIQNTEKTLTELFSPLADFDFGCSAEKI